MKTLSRMTAAVDWAVGVACIATLAGFAVLIAECRPRPPIRPTYSIDISIGAIKVPEMRDEDGYDPRCGARITRDDVLTVECWGSWDSEPVTLVVQHHPGVFDQAWAKTHSVRNMAVRVDWLEKMDFEVVNRFMTLPPDGQWFEDGRTRLHHCRKKTAVDHDFPPVVAFAATSDASHEIAVIPQCDDAFSRQLRSSSYELGLMLIDLAGLKAGIRRQFP